MFYSICHQRNLKYAIKKQLDTTTYLLEWLKSGTLTIPNVDTDVELQKFPCIADENAKWHFTREYGVSYKTKHTLNHSVFVTQLSPTLM